MCEKTESTAVIPRDRSKKPTNVSKTWNQEMGRNGATVRRLDFGYKQ